MGSVLIGARWSVSDATTVVKNVTPQSSIRHTPPGTISEQISHLATVEIRVVRLGSFQNLYLSFAIVEITHGVIANRDDSQRHYDIQM